MTVTRRRWLRVVTAAVSAAGCTVPGPEDGVVNAPLSVAAASDLQTTLPEVVERFLAVTPNHKVEVVYGASGQLANQIAAGAPWDLFLSANENYVTSLARQGHVRPGSIRPFAIGTLVLAVHRGAGRNIARLDDLARSDVRHIAIANPEVAPYGAAARTALVRAGLWDKVEPKIVRAETVHQALRFVQTGNAEAGLVSAATADGAEVRVVEIDPALYDPIVQALGVLNSRGHETERSWRFVQFLTEGPGRSVLESHGFRLPPAVATPP